MAACCSSCARSSSRALRTRIAFARFFSCERSSWHVTTSPVGRCVIRTAESVVLTPCPPGPEDRYTSTRRSFSSILTSTSSASGSTATVTVEVWIRPLDSVTGTRCTRWTPRSNFRRLQAPRPWMNRITSLNPPTPVALASITSTRHRWRSAYFVYMRLSSAAKRAASSPPAPARISTNTFFSLFGSRGSRSRFRSSSSVACRAVRSSISACASSASSRSPPSARMWRASPIRRRTSRYAVKRSTISTVSACSFRSRAYSAGWPKIAGLDRALAISLDRSSIWRSLSNSITAQRAFVIAAPRPAGPQPRDGLRRALRRGRETRGKQKAGPGPTRPASERELRRRGLAPVLPLEALDTTRGVHELVLPGIEGMALRADLHVDVGPGGAGANHLSASARDGRIHIVRMNAHLHSSHPLRGSKDTRSSHRVHRGQEFLVRLRELELVQQELHALHGVELGERLAQEPDLLELVLLEEQLFLPRPRLLDVDRGEDPLVHQPAIEMDLHVARPLELLEDDVVHPASGVDDGRRHDRERAALLDVPRRGEEAARPLERVRVEAARQDLARRRDDGVVGAREAGERVEQDHDVPLVLHQPLGLLDHHVGDLDVALGWLVEGGRDHLALHRPLHVGDFLRPLVDEKHDEVDLGMIRRDRMGDGLEHHRLAGPGRGHDHAALALADRTQEIHDPGRQVLGVVLEPEPLHRIERRQVVEEDLLARLLRRLEIDRLDLEQCEVPFRVLRRPHLAGYGIARAEVESSDLGRRNVNIVRSGQVVIVRGPQESKPIGQNLQNARGEDETVLLRLRLEDLEDQLLLAQPAHVLDVQVASDHVQVRDALFLQLGEVHPVHFGILGRAALASFSAGAHQRAPGGWRRKQVSRLSRLPRFDAGLES